MFRIPNYFQMDMTWDDAVRSIRGRGDGTLIGGIEEMNDYWNPHAAGNSPYETDSEFYENWIYEVNAYNIVFEGMGQLFADVYRP